MLNINVYVQVSCPAVNILLGSSYEKLAYPVISLFHRCQLIIHTYLFIFEIRNGSGRNQHLYNLHVSFPARHHQSRPSIVVLLVHVGPLVDQLLHHLLVTPRGVDNQGGGAISFQSIHFSFAVHRCLNIFNCLTLEQFVILYME